MAIIFSLNRLRYFPTASGSPIFSQISSRQAGFNEGSEVAYSSLGVKQNIKALFYNQKMERKCLKPITKRRYEQISIKRRECLVECVMEKGMALSKAARRYNIKLSTAKLILKRYKETGQFFPKKCQKIGLDHPEITPEASECHEMLENRQEEINLDQNPIQLEAHKRQIEGPDLAERELTQPFGYLPWCPYAVPFFYSDYLYFY